MQTSQRIRTLIVTGQSSQWHNWKISHAAIKDTLERSGLFEVSVEISPAAGEDMSGFVPAWDRYELIVVDYEGDAWPATARQGFERFVETGGGVVIFHASNNAFPDWPTYNQIIGIGGWAGRDERSGPMLRWRNGVVERDSSPGSAQHPASYAFRITSREPGHPIMRGLPSVWLHGVDELYSQLRGPAIGVAVLATARADPAEVELGTGENEPMLMTINFGRGRVFHTTLGHVGPKDTKAPDSMRCVGFRTTLIRGAEWAATGAVTYPVPERFPTADEAAL